ncbi:hypothetical protein KAK06_18425 [Ideonella sp. 4Y11]|uniref:MOSC domain-containing protein n=1 Tax=Ideonella aquatica TaxID=2824119 RepID=A0A940YS49_9BURK|nr:hypothetical protein [Ideonella aquatica]MBQ0960938.1 hypothetical protein [Ideonella aquatica]
MAIERIFTSPAADAPQMEHERITLRAGRGVQGDRNEGRADHPGQNLTLVEAEEIERFCAQHGRLPDLSITRRNLVTRGVRLNALEGRTFLIGAVRVRGVELCEPCLGLGQALSSDTLPPPAVVRHWVGRGGLRVDVLSDGEIARGDGFELA